VPALQVAPPVLGADNTVTLRLPQNFPLSTTRFRIGLFEAGRNVRVAEVQRDFTLRNGVFSAQITVQAAPGRYEVRLVSNDRNRTPFSAPAPLLVPGIDREPGWWLLNGSPFIQSAEQNGAAEPANAPLFVPGLKRDLSGKGKKPTANIRVPANAPLQWRVLDLQDSFSRMVTPGYDFAALETQIQNQIREARTRGERNLLGFALSSSGDVPDDTPAAFTAMRRLREILQRAAPEAALVFSLDTEHNHQVPGARGTSATLAMCDAVVLRPSNSLDSKTDLGAPFIWYVKAVRRFAEEQRNYDLPIFVQISPRSVNASSPDQDSNTAILDQIWLDAWMSGATGVIESATSTQIEPPFALWQQVVTRNIPLFVNAVTLEDIGILPDPALVDGSQPFPFGELRASGRIPLLAHLNPQKKGAPESLMLWFGSGRVSNATVEKLRAVANAGARIYLEGAPLLDESGKPTPWRMNTLVGADVTPLDQDALKDPGERSASITLQDGWMFGTLRGRRVPVLQSVSVKLRENKAGSGAIKEQRGRDVLTGPRVAATLADGSPALIINPVGKGEIIWAPHTIVPDLSGPRLIPGEYPHSRVGSVDASTPSEEVLNVDRSRMQERYYAAVSSYLQPSLVSVRGTNLQAAGAEAVRMALRRSPKGTLLLALFNASSRPAEVAAAVEGVAEVALDLATEQELPVSSRGFQGEARVTIPARGWKLIAFAATRKALDEERNAPRLQARLR
jgi:hypothetical protein